jgi:hypothetical protein
MMKAKDEPLIECYFTGEQLDRMKEAWEVRKTRGDSITWERHVAQVVAFTVLLERKRAEGATPEELAALTAKMLRNARKDVLRRGD